MTRRERRLAAHRTGSVEQTQKIQVFQYKDSDGFERKLHVQAMREWAENHLKLVGIDIDIRKIEDMLRGGRIDPEHFKNKTLHSGPKPVLVCDNFEDGKAEIVDGNHTYVAYAVAMAQADAMGLKFPGPMRAPAYVFTREQWVKFLI